MPTINALDLLAALRYMVEAQSKPFDHADRRASLAAARAAIAAAEETMRQPAVEIGPYCPTCLSRESSTNKLYPDGMCSWCKGDYCAAD